MRPVNIAVFVLLMSTCMTACSQDPSVIGADRRSSLSPGASTKASGVLVGRVMQRIGSPVQSAASDAQALAVPGVRLRIVGADHHVVGSVVSDAQGDYRMDLPAGVYRVDVQSSPLRGFSKDLPRTVTIGWGEEVRLDVHWDIGLR